MTSRTWTCYTWTFTWKLLVCDCTKLCKSNLVMRWSVGTIKNNECKKGKNSNLLYFEEYWTYMLFIWLYGQIRFMGIICAAVDMKAPCAVHGKASDKTCLSFWNVGSTQLFRSTLSLSPLLQIKPAISSSFWFFENLSLLCQSPRAACVLGALAYMRGKRGIQFTDARCRELPTVGL